MDWSGGSTLGGVGSRDAPAYVGRMWLAAVHMVAQWAGATAVVALMGCIIAAVLGVQFSSHPLAPSAQAFDLARLMALVGGTAVIVAGTTSTFYWWSVGVASDTTSAGIGCMIGTVGVLFAIAARSLLARTRNS
jgi:hypothetical protein